MAGLTITQRYEAIESSLNRIMEILTEASTVDDGAAYAEISDLEIAEMQQQVSALEQHVEHMKSIVEVLKKSIR